MDYIVHRPKRPYAIASGFFFLALALGLFVNLKQGFTDFTEDMLYLIALLAGGLIALRPALQTKEMIRLSDTVIRLEEKDKINLSDIEKINTESRRGYKGMTMRFLVLNLKDGTVRDLDIKALKMDEFAFFNAVEKSRFDGEFWIEEQ